MSFQSFFFIVNSQLFVQDAKMIWNKMKNVNEKSKHAFHMTHDGKQTVNGWVKVILV